MNKLLLLLALAFCVAFSNLNAQYSSEKIQKQWIKIDSIQDHELAKTKLLHVRNNAKKWSKENELDFVKRICFRYIYLTKYDSSLVYSLRGIELATELKQDSTLAFMYKIKGSAHYYLSDRAAAIQNYKKAVSLAEKKGFLQLNAHVLANLGAMYIEELKYKEAEKTLLKSIEINRMLGQSSSQQNLLALRLLGTNYNYQGYHKKALSVFDELIENCRKLNDSVVLASTLVFKASSLKKLGQSKKALILIDEALQIEKNIKDKHGTMATLMHYASILKETGDFEQALEKTHEAYKIRSEIFEEQMAKTSSDAEIKYQTKAIKRKQILAETQGKLLKKENDLYLIVISSILLILVLSGLLIYIRNQRKKVTLELFLQKERLAAIIEGEEFERTRIARELHDGVVQELTALKIKMNQVEENLPETHQSHLTELQKKLETTTQEVRNISYQMMPITLQEFGLIAALEDTLERSLPPHGIDFELNCLGIEERLPEKIEVTLFRVCQELINNALKHSQAKFISVLVRKSDQAVHFIFEDNGIGFDVETVQKGIGLSSLKSRIDLVQGELVFDSEIEKGTRVFIRISL